MKCLDEPIIKLPKRIIVKGQVKVQCEHCPNTIAVIKNGFLVIEARHHGHKHSSNLPLKALVALIKDDAMEFEVINGGKAG